MIKYLFLPLLSICILFTACSNKNNYSRKPVTNIQITPTNKIIPWGNDFTINYSSTVKNGKISTVEVLLDNKVIETSDKLSNSYNFPSENLQPGTHQFTVNAIKNDGVKSTHSITFFIVSNVVPARSRFKLLGELNHNPEYFTQGLEFYNDKLYEGTGNYGSSIIVSYNPNNGKIFNSKKIEDKYFGEGITILNNKLYQLTYQSKKGFYYNLETFERLGEFTFNSAEGWGLTNDGKNLIMSDGTSKITYLDPETFKIVNQIEVTDNNGIVTNINELEYVKGVIYANIWMTNTILKFDASNGKVLNYYNLESLKSNIKNEPVDVLNGIAFNEKENLFYVTGKFWPKMFKVQFVD
jgi:glutaminyl-peptide cyclotransferase